MRISDWSSDVCSSDLKAIDALINYETVKYFGNEGYELDRYDRNLSKWVDSAVKNQVSLNALNMGQGVIITIGITLLLWLSRSEERRVGKECVSTGSSRWSPLP